jgi:hypothetical protein
MRYSQSGILKDTRPWGKMFVAGAAAVTIAVGMFAAVSATHNSTGCTFDDVTVPGTWSLTADCTTTAPIEVPANTIVDGNGKTITANFNFVSNASGINKVVGLAGSDNVTINDLTVDSGTSVDLHGINVYESAGVVLNDVVTKNNDKAGLVVNSSTVTVNNLTTEGNGWYGVNVDKKTAEAASLTVNSTSSHNELWQIYVDDTTIATVVDTDSQYDVSTLGPKPNDAIYTLKDTVACGGTTSSYTITANWDDSTDASNDVKYRYEVTTPNQTWTDPVLLNQSSRQGEFNDGEGTYTYRVQAIDAAGNESEWSSYCAVTYDPTPQVLGVQDCKDGGFKNVYTADDKAFKNQGACVSYVKANDNASFKREQ